MLLLSSIFSWFFFCRVGKRSGHEDHVELQSAEHSPARDDVLSESGLYDDFSPNSGEKATEEGFYDDMAGEGTWKKAAQRESRFNLGKIFTGPRTSNYASLEKWSNDSHGVGHKGMPAHSNGNQIPQSLLLSAGLRDGLISPGCISSLSNRTEQEIFVDAHYNDTSSMRTVDGYLKAVDGGYLEDTYSQQNDPNLYAQMDEQYMAEMQDQYDDFQPPQTRVNNKVDYEDVELPKAQSKGKEQYVDFKPPHAQANGNEQNVKFRPPQTNADEEEEYVEFKPPNGTTSLKEKKPCAGSRLPLLSDEEADRHLSTISEASAAGVKTEGNELSALTMENASTSGAPKSSDLYSTVKKSTVLSFSSDDLTKLELFSTFVPDNGGFGAAPGHSTFVRRGEIERTSAVAMQGQRGGFGRLKNACQVLEDKSEGSVDLDGQPSTVAGEASDKAHIMHQQMSEREHGTHEDALALNAHTSPTAQARQANLFENLHSRTMASAEAENVRTAEKSGSVLHGPLVLNSVQKTNAAETVYQTPLEPDYDVCAPMSRYADGSVQPSTKALACVDPQVGHVAPGDDPYDSLYQPGSPQGRSSQTMGEDSRAGDGNYECLPALSIKGGASVAMVNRQPMGGSQAHTDVADGLTEDNYTSMYMPNAEIRKSYQRGRKQDTKTILNYVEMLKEALPAAQARTNSEKADKSGVLQGVVSATEPATSPPAVEIPKGGKSIVLVQSDSAMATRDHGGSKADQHLKKRRRGSGGGKKSVEEENVYYTLEEADCPLGVVEWGRTSRRPSFSRGDFGTGKFDAGDVDSLSDEGPWGTSEDASSTSNRSSLSEPSTAKGYKAEKRVSSKGAKVKKGKVSKPSAKQLSADEGAFGSTGGSTRHGVGEELSDVDQLTTLDFISSDLLKDESGKSKDSRGMSKAKRKLSRAGSGRQSERIKPRADQASSHDWPNSQESTAPFGFEKIQQTNMEYASFEQEEEDTVGMVDWRQSKRRPSFSLTYGSDRSQVVSRGERRGDGASSGLGPSSSAHLSPGRTPEQTYSSVKKPKKTSGHWQSHMRKARS